MTPLTLRLSARIAFLLSNAAAADVASVILLRSRSPSLNLLCTVVPILFANAEGTFAADDDDSAFSEDATSIPSPSSSDLMETAQNERSSRRRDCK